MKKSLILLLAGISFNSFANCTDGTCPNYPLGENEVWTQDQSNSITNANTAVMQQQMYLSSPIGNIPVNSVGKDGASCSQSFNYISAGASKAKLSGVKGNNFGDGSWAAGIQVGRVFTDSDDNCKDYQAVMKQSAEFSYTVEKNMHCLRVYNTYKDSKLNPLQTLLRMDENSLVRQQCQSMFELWQADTQYKQTMESNLTAMQNNLSKPQYKTVNEKVKVGYHEYRVRFLDWVNGCTTGCNSATGFNSLQEYLTSIKKNLPSGAKVYTVPYNNQKRISIFVRGGYLSETEAYKAQQWFYAGNYTTWVQGVNGAEKWKIVSKKVRIN